MTDQLRQAAQQAMDFLMTRRMGAESVITALNEALAQEHAMHELARLGQEIEQAETPPEWLLVKNILDEYGLDAIAFVAEWKAAQRRWQGLTEQDMPSGEDPMFDHLYFIAGMVYADKVLMEKNT